MPDKDLLNPTPIDPADHLPAEESTIKFPSRIEPLPGRKFYDTKPGLHRDKRQVAGYDPTKHKEYLSGVFTPTGGAEAMKEMQSRLQPWDDLAMRGAGRFVSKTLTEIGKLPGYAIGGVGAIGTGDIRTMVDNAWVNFFEDIDESVKESLPVYASPLLESKSLWENMTSGSFWATDFSDALGFLVSMFTPGIVLKAAGVGGNIARGINSAKLMKLGKPASVIDKVKRGVPLGTADLKLLGKTGLVSADRMEEIAGISANTVFEAAAEAAGMVDNLKIQLGEKVKKGEMTQAEADAEIEKAGTNVFLNNIALLIAPNTLSYKAVMGQFAPFRSMTGRMKGTGGQLVKEAPKLGTWSKVGRAVAAIGAGAVSEGAIEEGGQFAIEDYYHDKALGLTDKGYMEGIMESYKKAWDTLEGQKAMAIGAILGSGMGGIQTVRESNAFNKNANKLFKMLEQTNTDFSKNLDSLYKTELYTDEEGNQKMRYILDEDTKQPVIDPLKVEEYLRNVADGKLTDLYMGIAAMTDNKDLYDTAFNDMMTKLVVPYASLEGGMELLEGQLEAISEKMAKAMASEGVNISENTSKIKAELMSKAEAIAKDVNFMDIYDNKYFKLDIPNQSYAEQRNRFIGKLKNAVVLKSSEQRFHQKKIDEHSEAIEEIEGSENISELDKEKVKEHKIKIEEHTKIRDKRIQEIKDILNKRMQQEAFAAQVEIEEAKKEEAESQGAKKTTESSGLTGFLKELWDKNTFTEKVKFDDIEGAILHSSELNVTLPADINLEDYLKDTSVKDAGAKMPTTFTMTKATRNGNIELTSTNPKITQKAYLNSDGSFVFGDYRLDGAEINITRDSAEMREAQKVEARLKSIYNEGVDGKNKGVIQILRDQLQRIEEGIGKKFEEIDILMKALGRAKENTSEKAYVNLNGAKVALTVNAIEKRILDIEEGEKTIDPDTGQEIIIVKGIKQLREEKEARKQEMEGYKQEYRKLKKGFLAKDPSVTFSTDPYWNFIETVEDEVVEWGKVIEATEEKIKAIKGVINTFKNLLKGAYALYTKTLETLFPSEVPINNVEDINEIAESEEFRNAIDATLLGEKIAGRKRHVEGLEEKIKVKEEELAELNKKLAEYKSKLNSINPATGQVIEGTFEKALRQKKQALKRFYKEYMGLAKRTIVEPAITPAELKLGKEDRKEGNYDATIKTVQEEEDSGKTERDSAPRPPFLNWMSFLRSVSSQALAATDSNIATWFNWLESYDPATTDVDKKSTAMIYSYQLLEEGLNDDVTFYVRSRDMQMTKTEIEKLKEINKDEYNEVINEIREEKELKIVIINKKSKQPVYHVDNKGDRRLVFTTLPSGQIEDLYYFRDKDGKIKKDPETGEKLSRFSYDNFKKEETKKIQDSTDNYKEIKEEGGERLEKFNRDTAKIVENKLADKQKEEGKEWIKWRTQFFPEKGKKGLKPLEMGIAWKNPGAKQKDVHEPWAPVVTRIVENPEDIVDLNTNAKIFVATKSSMSIKGRTYPLKIGSLYVINQGRVEWLKPKTLEETGETDRILHLIRYYAHLDRNIEKATTEEQSATKELVEILRESLGSVLYFNYPKSKPKDFPFKMYMTPTYLIFGDNKISIDELVREADSSKIQELKEFLNTKYHHTDARSLSAKKDYTVYTVRNPKDLSKGLDQKVYEYNPKITKTNKKKKAGYLDYLLLDEDDGTSSGTAKYETNVKAMGDVDAPQYLNSSIELSENKDIISPPIVSPEVKEANRRKKAAINKNKKGKTRQQQKGTGRKGTKITVQEGDKTVTVEAEGEVDVSEAIGAMEARVNASLVEEMESGGQLPSRTPKTLKAAVRYELRNAPNTQKGKKNFINNVLNTGEQYEFDVTKEQLEKEWDKYWQQQESSEEADTEEVDTTVEEPTEREAAIRQLMDLFGISEEDAIKKLDEKEEEGENPQDMDRLADLKKIERILSSKEIEWFMNKYPDFPIRKVAGLIGGKSYGRFKRNLTILLSDIATEGTLYHEAFHIVSQVFMTPAQRKDMYQEVRERLEGQTVSVYNEEGTAFIEVEGENLTDFQAEEFLAEEFRSFALAEGNYNFPKDATEQKGFFETIWNFIKDFFNTLRGEKNEAPYSIEKIFQDIMEVPSYNLKDRKGDPVLNLDRISRTPIITTNSKGEKVINTREFDESYSLTLIKDFNYTFFNSLLEEQDPLRSSKLLDFNAKSLKLLWGNTLLSYMGELATIERLDKKDQEKYKGRKKLISDIIKNYKNITEEHVNFLKQYGIGIKGDIHDYSDMMEDSETEAARETRDNRGWNESNAIPVKTIMPPAVRLIIAGLALKEERTIEILNDEIIALEDTLKNAKPPYIESIQNKISLLKKELETIRGKVINKISGKEIYYSSYEAKLHNAKTPEAKEKIRKDHEIVTPERRFKPKTIGEYKAHSTVKYGTTINKLQDILIGLNEEEVISKLEELSTKNPEFRDLSQWLKLEETPDSLSKDDSQLQTQFFNQFNMNKNLPLITLVTKEGNLLMIDAVNASTKKKLLSNWRSNIKSENLENTLFVKDKNGQIILDTTKRITLPSNRQKEVLIKDLNLSLLTTKDRYALLKSLGFEIEVPFDEISDYSKLEGVDWILTTMQKRIKEGHKVSIDDIFTKEGLDVTGRVDSLLEYIASFDSDNVDLQYQSQDGKTAYSITLNSTLANIVHRLNRIARRIKEIKKESNAKINTQQFLDEIDEIMLPFSSTNPEGNLYSTNSEWMSKILDGKEIRLRLLTGMKEKTDSGIDTSNLSHSDFTAMSFNSIMKGKFTFLRAADRKLEYAFEIEDETVSTTIDTAKFTEDFKRYLVDELLTVGGLVKFGIGENLKNYRENATDLRFFKDILPESFIEDYKALITSEEIEDLPLLEKATEKFVRERKGTIDRHLDTYFQGAKARVKNKLLETRIIDLKSDDHYASNGIDPDIIKAFKIRPENINSNQLDKVLASFTYNVLKSHIEQTKLFTGDPAMFKSIEEFHKRTTGAASTRQASRQSLPFELTLRRLYKRADGKAYDGNARKVVYEDADAVPEEYPGEIATEGDAQGRTTLDGHREILLRQGTWREQEETYQYEIQSFFLKLLEAKRTFNGEIVDDKMFKRMFGEHTNDKMPQLPGGKLGEYAPMYEGKTIKRGELTPIPPIKPQGFGNITGLSNLQATDFSKLSLAPIMLSDLKPGDPMFERVLNMMENQIDIGVFVSGEKATAYVDGNGKLQQYYNEVGAPVPIDENLIQLQSFQDFGIQLEIDPLGKDKTRKATQQERLLFVDLFDLGESSLDSQSSKDKISKLKETRDKLSNEYVKREREKLIQKLGLEETKSGEFKLIDNDATKFRDLLLEELTRRQMPTNVAEGLTLAMEGQNKILDSLITKDEIESILMGLVRNRVIATKVNGYQAVQEASTGHEKENRTWVTIKGKDGTTKKVLTSNYLKSYTKNEDGTISPMEVEIPLPQQWNTWVDTLTYTKKGVSYTGLEALNKMIEDKDKRIDEKLLLITGNRIPADGLHSLEAMRVKRFLPTHFGQKIILPTGIVIKAGSDFDIDKLTIYLPNVKMTSKGPKYKSFSSSPLTKERVSEIYDERYGRLHKDFDKLEQLRAQAEIVAGIENKEVSKLLAAIFNQDLDIIEEEIQENTIKLFKSKLELRGLEFKDYEKLKEKIGKIPSKKEFIDQYEGKDPVVLNGNAAIENKMIEIAQETILLPENYEQLLNPVSADTLLNISKEVKKEDKAPPSYTNLMEWAFNTEVARNNWEGTRGRALSAIATASHSLTQIVPITIEDPKVEIYLQGQERKKGKYKMGHVKDSAGKLISNNLGEFLSAYVDVAKDPFIRFLNMGDRVFPIYNFLQRFSNSNPADLETLMYLVTQPIIQDFINELEVNSSIFLKAAGKNKGLEEIIQDLYVKYSTEGTTVHPPAEWMSTHYRDIQSADTNIDKKIAEDHYVAAKRKSDSFYLHLNKDQLKKAKDSIEEGTRSTESLNIQLQVLDNILLYDSFSKNLKSFQQVARPDASLGARRSSLKIRDHKLKVLKEEGFFSRQDIEDHFNNTYIREFNTTQESVVPMYSEFFFTDKYGKELGGFLQSMMEPYLSKKANMSERDLYKVAQNIENELLTFILHTQTSPVWKKNTKDISRSLNEFYKDILLGKNSPALQLKEVNKKIRILEKTIKGGESNLLFQRLIPEIKEFVVRRGRIKNLNNIKLLDVKSTTEEINSMTSLFSELFESGDPKLEEFAMDLIKLQLVQSGMSSSIISFGKIIPEEYFQPIANEIISKWIQERITDKKYPLHSFLENFRQNFFRGAWSNPVVIPKKHSKVMNKENYYTGQSYYDPNKMDIKIYKKDKAAAFDWIAVEGYSVNYSKVRELQQEAEAAGRPYANIPSEVYLFKKVYNTNGSPKLTNRNRSYVYERVEKLGDGMYFTEYYNNPNPFSILSYNEVKVVPKSTKKKKSPAEIAKAETERDKDPSVELDKKRRKKGSKKDMPSLFEEKETQSSTSQVVQERMRTFLKAIGVDVKEVAEIYDRRGKVLNASGLAKLSENIVEIIKGTKGLDSLPEEAAHFFVSLLPSNSPLKKAMFDNITNYDIYQDTLEKYKDYYGEDIDAIKEEAVGKLIAKRILDIQNGDTAGMLDSLDGRQKRQVNTWFNQLIRWVKNLFSKVNTDPFVKSAYKMLQADVSNLVPEVSEAVAEEEMPSLDETFEEERKEANDKYLKKAPYWFNGKQYRDNKTFSSAVAQSVANKINQNYSTLDAKVVNIEEGKARIVIYPKRKDMPSLEVELRKPENKNDRKNNSIVNVKEVKKVSTPSINTLTEASNELMTNFEKYFPQYSHYTEEERKAFIQYMANGNIEIKCKL